MRRARSQARYGVPRGARRRALPLLVLGMGKLGGGELNFSSDIDLVFLFPEHGETDGGRGRSSTRSTSGGSARRVAQLLGTVTAEGFVYRVDLRLRPFGESGPQVVSFDAFEEYLQQHGRDWERYAYVKARPVVGGDGFDELYRDVLRPFVYRRYLDFSVFESLREMKELISREVERRELQGNVKLGPGGIREIEFIVQAFQLMRGGGDPAAADAQPAQALPLLAGQKLLSRSGGDGTRRLVPVPATAREPPAGAQRRADARAAAGRRGTRAPCARHGRRRTGRRSRPRSRGTATG